MQEAPARSTAPVGAVVDVPEGLPLEAPTLADVLAYGFAETDTEAVTELPQCRLIPGQEHKQATYCAPQLLDALAGTDVFSAADYPDGDADRERLQRARNRATRRHPLRDVLPPDHPALVNDRPGRIAVASRERAHRTTPNDAMPERWPLPPLPGTSITLADLMQSPDELKPKIFVIAAAYAEFYRRMVDLTSMLARAARALIELMRYVNALREANPLNLAPPATGPEREGPAPPSPPPEQLALVRSTLTAAPPQGTVSVPSPCCAVLPSKLAA